MATEVSTLPLNLISLKKNQKAWHLKKNLDVIRQIQSPVLNSRKLRPVTLFSPEEKKEKNHTKVPESTEEDVDVQHPLDKNY